MESLKSTNKCVPKITRRLSDKGSPISLPEQHHRFPSRGSKSPGGSPASTPPDGSLGTICRRRASDRIHFRIGQGPIEDARQSVVRRGMTDPSQFWASLGNFTVVSKSRIQYVTVCKQASTSTSASEAKTNKPKRMKTDCLISGKVKEIEIHNGKR